VPEGHTIHRLARDHARAFQGAVVSVSTVDGRFPGATLLDGTVLRDTSAHGKHLFHHYDAGVVQIHLGLIGKFYRWKGEPPTPRPTVRMRLSDAERTFDLVGAIICRLITPDEAGEVMSGLGPDPLRADADPMVAYAALQRRSVGIGRALLDQAVLAGVGNVFRCEVLFVHGIHPEVPAKQISVNEWLAIWETLVDWLRIGVRMNRIVTVGPVEAGRPRSRILRADATYVYKQDRCRRCNTEIRRWDLAGRWSYACETCQLRR
jgi:endonuclease-8